MTKMQELLGKILKNRINAELKKDASERDFTSIQETMDILFDGGKITTEQYTELSNLISQ